MTDRDAMVAARDSLLARVSEAFDWEHQHPADLDRLNAELRAALAAPPSDSLDVAWAEAEAALTSRADWWRIRSLVEVAFAPMRWEVVATDGNRIVRAEGHDAAAALNALAAALAPEVTR